MNGVLSVSSEMILRIILFIAGLIILGGIVLHHHLSSRKKDGARSSKRREPRFQDLDLPLAEDPVPPEEDKDWGQFNELNDPPLLDQEDGPAPAAPEAEAAAEPDSPPPLHMREAAPGDHQATERATEERRQERRAKAAQHVPAVPSPTASPMKAGPVGRPVPRASGTSAVEKANNAPKPDKIITLYIRARTGRKISGVELLDAAIKTGLQFGQRKIFHRTQEGQAEPLFSMANLVKPGNFDPGSWNVFETPGVALFMTLPGPITALDSWDAMHAAGQRLAELLDAELLDDHRARMSRQRIAQMREDLREYDRKREIKRSLDHDS